MYLKICSFISLLLILCGGFTFSKQRNFDVNQDRESLLLKKSNEIKIDEKIVQDVSAISKGKLEQLLAKFEDIQNTEITETDINNLLQLIDVETSNKEVKAKNKQIFETLTYYVKERSIIEFNAAKDKAKFHISSILENILLALYANKKLETAFAGLSGDLSEAVLDNLNLTGARFAGANLTRTSFKNSNLTEANFSKANLGGAVLKGAVLIAANLKLADLNGTNLSEAVLSGAVLSSSFSNAVNSRSSVTPIPKSNLANYEKRDIVMLDDNPKSDDGYKKFSIVDMKDKIDAYAFKDYVFYEIAAISEFLTPEEKPEVRKTTPSSVATTPSEPMLEDDASLLLDDKPKEGEKAPKEGGKEKTPAPKEGEKVKETKEEATKPSK